MSQKTDDVASVVQIDDPEIDVQTIMARIREGLVEHALDEDVEFPTFAVARARRGKATRFPEELYYQLEQANLNYDRIWVELSMVEGQMPLMGRFVNRFKRELHRLVVYYVNMLGERQVTMNDALVRTLNQLVDSLERSPELVEGRSPELVEGRSPELVEGRSPDGSTGSPRGPVEGRSPDGSTGSPRGSVEGALDEVHPEIEALRHEVTELRARLAKLEAQVAAGE
jgi:hypothetical protein